MEEYIMKATRIHMPCRECHVIHANAMSSTLCSDCGIKLRKENEELEAEWLAFQEQETKWKNTL
jgi:hypothetical protein|tara:strand:+ start:173 stop:364 length:192 start_codon:yes stop_codon:yes gene_type:complete